MVQHGSDTVKPETVKVILLLPELQVGQQEVDHFALFIVEALGAPGAVITLCTVMEELIHSAVKLANTFTGILGSMGMDHIQQHRNAHLMGFIDQCLQLLRCTEAGRSGK